MYSLVRRYIKTAVAFLGVGLVLGEAARPWVSAAWLRWTVALGGVVQAVGLLVYFWGMWPRIRPVGSHLREASGERF